MKRSLSILLALFLVVGVASSALAAFESGNMFFVAYNEDESVGIEGINEQAGFESFFDLGATSSFATAIQNGDLIDTNISLSDFGNPSNGWGDVFIATFGQADGGLNDFTAFFSSEDPGYNYNAGNFGFSGGYGQIQNFLEGDDANVVRDKLQTNSYYGQMQASGTEPGSYGGPVSAGTQFGAESNLEGIGSAPADWLTLAIYGGDTFNDLIDPDGDFNGQLPLISNIKLGLDAADGSLVINPVPVPAAVWMLGSGLLALVGMRRRKMK
jgi:hypothetical protein